MGKRTHKSGHNKLKSSSSSLHKGKSLNKTRPKSTPRRKSQEKNRITKKKKDKNNSERHSQRRDERSDKRQVAEEEGESNDEELDMMSAVSQSLSQSKLMTKFEERLKGGHFRFVNQGLYTSNGRDSFSLFQKNERLFHEYHEGYLRSMKHWSIQPVDIAIQWLKKQPSNQKVVDYGCGEAKIMRAGLSQTVTSLDLVALHPGVVVCDMSHSPLERASQDIAVFSLSLMGTDYFKCLLDAAQVLKVGGVLWIAEVCSRFADLSGKEDYRPFFNALEELGFERTLAKKPSKMFAVFVFKKAKNVDKPGRIRWPTLKPCLYKKR